MAADSPERFVATITKSKRKDKILIDYLRNGAAQHAVAPYSTRARPGAAVSMPLAGTSSTRRGSRLLHRRQPAGPPGRISTRSVGDFRTGRGPLPAGRRGRSRAA